MEPARQLRVKIDQDQARQIGVSSAAIAAVLNAAITGSTVTQIRDDIYLVNVVARAVDKERASVETLRSLQVPIPGGRTVAAEPVRDLRVRARVPAGVAARPGADAHRARGHGARRAAGHGRGRSSRRRSPS